MKDQISQPDIMEAFHTAALHYGGNKKLAADLDMSPSTLSNKLAPYPGPDHRHKLGFLEADDILSTTGDMRPLELLAARHGFLLLSLHAEPDAPTSLEEALQDVQSLAAYQAAKMLSMNERIHRLNELLRDIRQTETAIAKERGESIC